MSDQTAPTPGASPRAEDSAGVLTDARHQAVSMRGMGLIAALLLPYLGAQLFALFAVDNTGYLDLQVMTWSVAANAGLCAWLALSYFVARRRVARRPQDPQLYWLSVWCSAALIAVCLLHVHLIGSQNSLHHLLLVAILLVVSWLLRWREVLIFYVLGNLGLALLVTLEMNGVLPYAPLLVEGDSLARIFLDWRTVLAQSINYLLVLVATTALVWLLRRLVERTERERAAAMAEARASSEQVATLRGLLPICADCKKIRDDQGYWTMLEVYLKQHAPEVTFSHGVCPDCEHRLYGD